MKTLLITGGSGDIGQAIVHEFQHQGYTVLAPTRHELDMEQPKTMPHAIQAFPHIDAFIHCAGMNKPKAFVNINAEDFTQTMAVNAHAFYYLTQALTQLGKLQKQGHILAISSIYGDISRKGRFSYTASKYCLNGMVKNLALELGPQQIKVNGLAPGFVETRLTRQNNSAEVLAKMQSAIPLGHLADVRDIAKIAYFLASKENAYINGQIITADGGYTAGGFQE